MTIYNISNGDVLDLETRCVCRCGRSVLYGDMTWLNGVQMCPNCYQKELIRLRRGLDEAI